MTDGRTPEEEAAFEAAALVEDDRVRQLQADAEATIERAAVLREDWLVGALRLRLTIAQRYRLERVLKRNARRARR